MDEWNSRLLSVRQEKISADNVYQLLLVFDKLYNTFTEVEQRDFMRSFIKRIDIYPEKPDNGCWIRNIVFNFPMPVQGKYGFHVTNLNIAQVKQKHGIIERENYNKPKSENSRQPGCPEEKVKAIEEALRQFQMIK